MQRHAVRRQTVKPITPKFPEPLPEEMIKDALTWKVPSFSTGTNGLIGTILMAVLLPPKKK